MVFKRGSLNLEFTVEGKDISVFCSRGGKTEDS